MKITVNTSVEVATKTIDTIVEASREFTNSIDMNMAEEAKTKLHSNSRAHYGPATCWQYDVYQDDNHKPNAKFCLSIEDDAILMYLPMLIRLAKVLSPLYDMGKSAIKLMRNLGAQVKGICNSYSRKFERTYGKPKTYAVTSVWNTALELFDVVVVEDDGFDNQRLVLSIPCGRHYSADIIMQIFNDAQRKGRKTENDKTVQYPLAVFEEITREKAEEKAHELRKALQADVDGYYKEQANDEAEPRCE